MTEQISTTTPPPETFDHWWEEHVYEIRKTFELAFVAGQVSGIREIAEIQQMKKDD